MSAAAERRDAVPIGEAAVRVIDQVRHTRVLDLWRGGKHSTSAISIATGLTELEVCQIIPESDR